MLAAAALTSVATASQPSAAINFGEMCQFLGGTHMTSGSDAGWDCDICSFPKDWSSSPDQPSSDLARYLDAPSTAVSWVMQ